MSCPDLVPPLKKNNYIKLIAMKTGHIVIIIVFLMLLISSCKKNSDADSGNLVVFNQKTASEQEKNTVEISQFFLSNNDDLKKYARDYSVAGVRKKIGSAYIDYCDRCPVLRSAGAVTCENGFGYWVKDRETWIVYYRNNKTEELFKVYIDFATGEVICVTGNRKP